MQDQPKTPAEDIHETPLDEADLDEVSGGKILNRPNLDGDRTGKWGDPNATNDGPEI